jgi:hypothetical protein
MIDIETLDTTPSAVVIQIAAVVFSYTEKGAVKIISEFDTKLPVETQLNNGRTISADTITFWLKKYKQQLLLGELLSAAEDGHHFTDLKEFLLFCSTSGASEYWSQGPTFDTTILEDMVKQSGVPDLPWKFYQVRDLRTVQKFVGDDKKSIEMKKASSNHNAHDDCHSQIKLLQHFIKKANK